MKRYVLFEIDNFYPLGGLSDLSDKGPFYDTIEEARSAYMAGTTRETEIGEYISRYDYYQIVDTQTLGVVESGSWDDMIEGDRAMKYTRWVARRIAGTGSTHWYEYVNRADLQHTSLAPLDAAKWEKRESVLHDLDIFWSGNSVFRGGFEPVQVEIEIEELA